MLKDYYRLTKPGIIYGNLLSAIGGFLLASHRHFDVRLFLAFTIGTALVIASACVFNNIIDRDVDARMKRTQKRPLVTGTISVNSALWFGSIMGLLGLNILWRLTNWTTLILGFIGLVTYVLIYTYSKRLTVHSTLLGTIPGATPIAAGYTAVTGHFDLGAWLLLFVMVAWQMPHFYAIGMFRRDDYAAAELPILPVKKGMRTGKKHTLFFIAVFGVAEACLALFGYASFSFFIIMTGLSAYWFWQGTKGFRKDTVDRIWARQVFGSSLLILLIMSLMMSIDTWLP